MTVEEAYADITLNACLTWLMQAQCQIKIELEKMILKFNNLM